MPHPVLMTRNGDASFAPDNPVIGVPPRDSSDIASLPYALAPADARSRAYARTIEAEDVTSIVLGSSDGAPPAISSGQAATIGSNWWRIV